MPPVGAAGNLDLPFIDVRARPTREDLLEIVTRRLVNKIKWALMTLWFELPGRQIRFVLGFREYVLYTGTPQEFFQLFSLSTEMKMLELYHRLRPGATVRNSDISARIPTAIRSLRINRA